MARKRRRRKKDRREKSVHTHKREEVLKKETLEVAEKELPKTVISSDVLKEEEVSKGKDEDVKVKEKIAALTGEKEEKVKAPSEIEKKISDFSVDDESIDVSEMDIIEEEFEPDIAMEESVEEGEVEEEEVTSEGLEDLITIVKEEEIPDFALGVEEGKEEEREQAQESLLEDVSVEDVKTEEEEHLTNLEDLFVDHEIQEDVFSRLVVSDEEEEEEEAEEVVEEKEPLSEVVSEGLKEELPPQVEEKEEVKEEQVQVSVEEEEKKEEAPSELEEEKPQEVYVEEKVEEKPEVAEIEEVEIKEEAKEEFVEPVEEKRFKEEVLEGVVIYRKDRKEKVSQKEEKVEKSVEAKEVTVEEKGEKVEEVIPEEEPVVEESVEVLEAPQEEAEIPVLEEPQELAEEEVTQEEAPKEEVVEEPLGVKDEEVDIFRSKINRLESQMETVLKRLKALEVVKHQIKKSAAELKKAIDSLDVPLPLDIEEPLVEVEEEEIIEIPSLEVPEEPSLTVKEKRAIKQDVDRMLDMIGQTTLEKEAGQFYKVITSVSSLDFLKPRFSEVVKRGKLDFPLMVSFYRIAVKFLQEELTQKEREVKAVKREFENYKNQMKRLGDILGHRQLPGLPREEKEKPKEPDKNVLFVLREENKKKDKIIEELTTQLDRLRMDFGNFRSRQRREIEHQINRAKEKFLLDLLEVVDNFDRALDYAEEKEEDSDVVQGFKIIHDQLMAMLKKYKLKEIPAKGLKFDPYYHEALMREESLEYPDGTVIEVFKKGYMFGDKVIRPAQVKTSVKPQAVVAGEEEEVSPPTVEELMAKEEKPEEPKVEVKKEPKEEPKKEEKKEEYTLEAVFGGKLPDLDLNNGGSEKKE